MITSKIIRFVAGVGFLAVAVLAPAKEKEKTGGGMSEYNQGNQLFEQKQYDLAIAQYTAAIQANGKQPAYYENRGFAYLARGRAAEAWDDFSKAVELAPNDERAYIGRAQAMLLDKQYQETLADLDKAIQLKPDDGAAYKLRGFAEIGLSQWDKAVADFTAAIQKNPTDPQLYDRRAWANRNLKNYDAALADYTLMIEKNPSDPEPLVKRGATYVSMTQYDKGIADYQAALKLKPEDYDTVQRLQYAQGIVAAKNAPPPTPTPKEEPGLLTPLNIGIVFAVLIIIAVVVRLVTRGKEEPTSNRIR